MTLPSSHSPAARPTGPAAPLHRGSPGRGRDDEADAFEQALERLAGPPPGGPISDAGVDDAAAEGLQADGVARPAIAPVPQPNASMPPPAEASRADGVASAGAVHQASARHALLPPPASAATATRWQVELQALAPQLALQVHLVPGQPAVLRLNGGGRQRAEWLGRLPELRQRLGARAEGDADEPLPDDMP